jgi:hypothetical protein
MEMNPKVKLLLVMGVLATICVVTALVMNAPPFMYLIFIGIFVFLYFIFAPIYKQAAEQGAALMKEGLIITRDAEFMKNAQTFSLSKVSMDDLIVAIKNMGLPFDGLEWKTGEGVMTFKCSTWDAQMVKLESSDGRDRWKFSFLSWDEMRYGGASSFTAMNVLLTAVEKAFISLDPNTKVQTERIKVNTNSKFL